MSETTSAASSIMWVKLVFILVTFSFGYALMGGYEAFDEETMRVFMGEQRLKIDDLDNFIVEAAVRTSDRSSSKYIIGNRWMPSDLFSGPARVVYPRDWQLILVSRIRSVSSDVHWHEYGYRYRAVFTTSRGPREVTVALRGHTIIEEDGEKKKIAWHLFPDKGEVSWEPQGERLLKEKEIQ